jgi:hypothetical protein
MSPRIRAYLLAPLSVTIHGFISTSTHGTLKPVLEATRIGAANAPTQTGTG